MDITKIDKNMAAETVINKDGMIFYDVKRPPFRIYGVYHDGDKFRRLPDSVASECNDGVLSLSDNTAGGRVRFVTDSPRIAVMVKRCGGSKTDNITPINAGGLDLYSGSSYISTFRPGYDLPSEFESVRDIPEADRGRVFNINMTDYGGIRELYVGICEGSTLSEAPDYKYERPVVFYGSSITQGGCASRPGMAYEEILSRRLDMNYVNLGFSGSAKAEPAMADYIKGLDMSVFVYDYDHNAHSVEYLAKTHERMFKTIRETNPDLPIIILTRPDARPSLNRDRRTEVITRTYNNAVAAGDKNVYILYASEFFSEVGFEYTVDDTHPTDLGFWFMAKGIEPLLGRLLAEQD